MKAVCVHRRPWFRCGECNGEDWSAIIGLPGVRLDVELKTLTWEDVGMLDTPTSRHLDAMRAEYRDEYLRDAFRRLMNQMVFIGNLNRRYEQVFP